MFLVVSFEDALKKLKSRILFREQATLQLLEGNYDSAALQRVYDKYKRTFDVESNKLAKSVTDYPIESITKRIEEISSDLREKAVTMIQRTCGGDASSTVSGESCVPKYKVHLSAYPEELGELVGLVSASWTFLGCKGKPRAPEVRYFDTCVCVF